MIFFTNKLFPLRNFLPKLNRFSIRGDIVDGKTSKFSKNPCKKVANSEERCPAIPGAVLKCFWKKIFWDVGKPKTTVTFLILRVRSSDFTHVTIEISTFDSSWNFELLRWISELCSNIFESRVILRNFFDIRNWKPRFGTEDDQTFSCRLESNFWNAELDFWV